uniref:Uncharacterized protein n=1 Tax=Amphimedon queenslandica TaxID=400682 RepID=A0A1X7UAB3_AMPQE
MKCLGAQWPVNVVDHLTRSPDTISNAVALLSRIHPQTRWLPQLLQPYYTGKTSSYAYQTS